MGHGLWELTNCSGVVGFEGFLDGGSTTIVNLISSLIDIFVSFLVTFGASTVVIGY